MNRPLKILLAAPESDAHAVAPKLLEWALEERGYSVCNLGVCCPAVQIARAVADFLAWRARTVAVLLCCQNGHGLRDLANLPTYLEHLQLLGTPNVHLFAGGRLEVGAEAKYPNRLVPRIGPFGITPLDRSFEEAFARLEQLQESASSASASVGNRAPTQAVLIPAWRRPWMESQTPLHVTGVLPAGLAFGTVLAAGS